MESRNKGKVGTIVDSGIVQTRTGGTAEFKKVRVTTYRNPDLHEIKVGGKMVRLKKPMKPNPLYSFTIEDVA